MTTKYKKKIIITIKNNNRNCNNNKYNTIVINVSFLQNRNEVTLKVKITSTAAMVL